MRKISTLEGICSKSICEHCQAQINHKYSQINEQIIYSKLKSKGILSWRQKHKPLLKDSKITKSKYKDLSLSIKRRERPSIPKVDARIGPLLSSLISGEESLISMQPPIKRVSIKETVELIQEYQYGSRGIGKKLLKQDFSFNFPRQESLSGDIIGDMIQSSTELFKDTEFRLQMLAEDKKKKIEETKKKKLEENGEKRQAYIVKKEQFDVQKRRQQKAALDSKDKSIKRTKSTTSESESSKFDESKYKVKKRSGKAWYESEEDLDKSRKGQKFKEHVDEKKVDKGQSDLEQETKRKPQVLKKESIRGIEDKYGQRKSEKEKVLPAVKKELPGKEEEKFGTSKDGKPDKTKAVPGKGLQAPGVEARKSYKEKAMAAYGKDKTKLDKDKVLPAPGKGVQVPGKEKEEKSDKDKVLPVSRKEREEKLGEAKDEKPYKKVVLPAPVIDLQAPGKKKEDKSDKEKSLSALEKGLQGHEKEKQGKRDKEMALQAPGKRSQTPGTEEEKPDKDQVVPVSRRDREDKIDVTKDDKPYKKEVLPALGKGLQAPGKEKEDKSGKEKTIPAPGKELQAPRKEKVEKPDKEKALPGKGLQALGKENEEKSDKQRTLPPPGKGGLQSLGKKEEKSSKEKGLGQVPRKEREEKSGAEREVKLGDVKIKNNDVAAIGVSVLGDKQNKIKDKESRNKGGEEGNEILKRKDILDKKKQKPEQSKHEEENLLDNAKPKIEKIELVKKDLMNKNNIKVSKPDDNILLDLILKFERAKVRREMPTTLVISPLPEIPSHLMAKYDDNISYDTILEREIAEKEESSSIDEVVYINKIIKKHEIPLERGLTGTKERVADVVYTNIFKEDLGPCTEAMSQNSIVSESQGKVVLSKVRYNCSFVS